MDDKLFKRVSKTSINGEDWLFSSCTDKYLIDGDIKVERVNILYLRYQRNNKIIDIPAPHKMKNHGGNNILLKVFDE